MKIDLKEPELDTLIESLEYSKRAIRDAQGTPHETRAENLARLEALASKLREMKPGR